MDRLCPRRMMKKRNSHSSSFCCQLISCHLPLTVRNRPCINLQSGAGKKDESAGKNELICGYNKNWMNLRTKILLLDHYGNGR